MKTCPATLLVSKAHVFDKSGQAGSRVEPFAATLTAFAIGRPGNRAPPTAD